VTGQPAARPDPNSPCFGVSRPVPSGEAGERGSGRRRFDFGQVSVVEPVTGRRSRSPHLHTREDEHSILTEGEIGFRSGDREAELAASGYITKPRGERHTIWNAGDVPARMIEIISPAEFETSPNELSELVAVRPPPAGPKLGLCAQNYGLEFGEPPMSRF
jgi:mannose-6-phosphate isomerase-like protein (cupin superfamily)